MLVDGLQIGPFGDQDARLAAVVVEIEEVGCRYCRRVVDVVRRHQARQDGDVPSQAGEVQEVDDADDLIALAAVAHRRQV